MLVPENDFKNLINNRVLFNAIEIFSNEDDIKLTQELIDEPDIKIDINLIVS